MALRKFIRHTPALFRLSSKNALVELTVDSIPTIDEIQVRLCTAESFGVFVLSLLCSWHLFCLLLPRFRGNVAATFCESSNPTQTGVLLFRQLQRPCVSAHLPSLLVLFLFFGDRAFVTVTGWSSFLFSLLRWTPKGTWRPRSSPRAAPLSRARWSWWRRRFCRG